MTWSQRDGHIGSSHAAAEIGVDPSCIRRGG
jgi:hypothetical protein